MIRPAGYRILVKPDEINTKTDWGLQIVTDEKLERAAIMKGTVVAVGEFAYRDDPGPWVKVGDRIIYSQYAGKFIKDPVEDETFVVMNDEDVVALIYGEEGNE